MKKRVLSLILSAAMVLSLCACGSDTAVDSTATTEAATETVEEATTEVTADTDEAAAGTDYTTGSPWVDADILSNIEACADSTELKDNFAMATSSEWVQANPIKEGEVANQFLFSFKDELHGRIKSILTDDTYVDDHNAQLVQTLYNQYLDWDARDAAGTTHLMPYLEAIENISSMDELEDYVVSPNSTFADIWTKSVIANPGDTSQSILFITRPDFYLNDAADYENLDNFSDDVQLTYDCRRKAVQLVLSQCGYSDSQIDEIFDGAIKFEQLNAAYCYTNAEASLTETGTKINKQVYTPEELAGYDWYAWLEESMAGYGITDIPAVELSEKMDYFDNLDSILAEDNLDIIKDYLLAHTASSAVNMLDKDTYYDYLDIYNELYGATGYKEDTEYAVDAVSNWLDWPLAKLYIDKYVTEEDKQNIKDVIEDIITAYREMLQDEDFLSDATKEQAINKLDKMTINCMYPDDWSLYDYGDLELGDNYFDTVMAIDEYLSAREYEDFNEPIDKTEWAYTPILMNAQYSGADNSINIYAGLVGDVLYNSDMPIEEIYGKLGVAIGHEISHAFDANGATRDADGNLNNWWTDEDYENYNALTDKLVQYYNGITIWDGLNCDGELDKTEACADMGGMAAILHIAAQDEDFDYKTFFESYGLLWACNITPQYAQYRAKYDVHPLSYLRTNVTVAQFEEFYETYGIEEGDGMYIAPEDRVKIW